MLLNLYLDGCHAKGNARYVFVIISDFHRYKVQVQAINKLYCIGLPQFPKSRHHSYEERLGRVLLKQAPELCRATKCNHKCKV